MILTTLGDYFNSKNINFGQNFDFFQQSTNCSFCTNLECIDSLPRRENLGARMVLGREPDIAWLHNIQADRINPEYIRLPWRDDEARKAPDTVEYGIILTQATILGCPEGPLPP